MEIIILSEIKWQYMPTRKQNILSRLPKAWQMLFFEPYRLWSNYSVPVFHESNIRVSGIPFLKSLASDSIFAKIYRFIVSITILCRLYDWLIAWHVQNVARISGFRKPDLIIISNPYALSCAKIFKKLGAKVIYDANDAHAEFEGTLPFVKGNIDELCQLADIIVCASATLEVKILEDYKYSKKKTTTIGNGVDTSIFCVRNEKQFSKSKQINIFYSGAINERIDFDLIEKILIELPPKHFLIMVGPISRSIQRHIDYLEQYRNKHYQLVMVPPMEQTHLAGIMCHADVCILPFKKSPLTEVLNPNTMYEYLACGKAVIAMDVSLSMRAWANELVVFAKSYSDFILSLFELINNKKKLTAKMKEKRKWAEKNDWNIKAQEYKKLIEQLIGNRRIKYD